MSINKTNEKPYTEKTIKCSLEKIKNSVLSLRDAAQLYHIPKSTLSERKKQDFSSWLWNITKLSPFIELTFVHLFQVLGE